MSKKNFIRIIPKLDIKNVRLIKGINLEGLRILGEPFSFAEHYYKSGADEICYVDNVATLYGTNNLSSFISKLLMIKSPLESKFSCLSNASRLRSRILG